MGNALISYQVTFPPDYKMPVVKVAYHPDGYRVYEKVEGPLNDEQQILMQSYTCYWLADLLDLVKSAPNYITLTKI